MESLTDHIDDNFKGELEMAVWEQSKYDSEEQDFLINGMTVEEFMKNRKKEKEAKQKNGKDEQRD